MSRTTGRRVAIVGGGLSGLATAVQLHLADPSLELSLWEASDRLGGVIDTEVQGDFLMDLGADMFATQPPAAIKLLKQLGVEDQLIRPQPDGRGARILHRGKLIPLPDGFVLMRATKLWPMLTTPLLSVAGKLRMLREPWIRAAFTPNSSADLSVADFVRHRLGEEVLQNIVAPLVAGIYTADIEKLSMRATMGPLAEMERDHGSLAKATLARRRSGKDAVERGSSGARYEQFRAFRGGMIQLIDSLAKALPAGAIHTGSSVTAIEKLGWQWQLHVARERHRFDDVVIATPPPVAAKLIADVATEASSELAAIKSASTAIVVLALRRRDIRADINTFGFVIPPKERRQILAASFASNKFAGRAPDDAVLVRVFIGGMLQPELLQQTDDELIELAVGELGDLIEFSGEPILSRVVRWNDAMPQYHVGHLKRVERMQASIDAVPGLWLISNALRGVGISPVIHAAGKLAANLIAAGRRD